MSQRRMTSLEVINTDAFLDMPPSSQLLYFHLNARADDDGFVSNPRSVMRNCGGNPDDIKLLIAKKFIISFEDGVCVIKHWRINNYIRKDIYKETNYLNHKQTLYIRQNGAYTLTDDGRAVKVPNGHFQLEDIKPKNLLLEPQNNVHVTSTKRALRIGKDRKGKNTNKSCEQEVEFNFKAETDKLLASKSKTYNIVGHYITEKGFNFENKTQFVPFLLRNLKSAKLLKGYDSRQITKAFDYCKKKWPDDWVLETVARWIAEANKNN